MKAAASYGTTRARREEVTYAQIERAATDILKTGVRPTLESVRKAVGGGSPRTILNGLHRYWGDLGKQVAGQPDTLRRLPAAVADLAEGLWKRALSLATEAAIGSSTSAEEQLAKLKTQVELRSHTLSQRELELDELLRSRERTVKELEEQLRAVLTMLTKRDVSVSSLEARLAAALQDTAAYRRRLGRVLQRVVVRHQELAGDTPLVSKKHSRALARPRPKQSQRKRSGKS